MFLGQKQIQTLKKNCRLRTFLNFGFKNELMLKFSNLSVLRKGLLMQDCVFRLGYRTKFISDATRNESGYLKLKCRSFGRESL